MISVARLRELLDYDPVTGVFTNKVRRGKAAAGSRAGRDRGDGYRNMRVEYTMMLEHRVAWAYVTGEWPTFDLDHKDRNPGNNAFSNLRPCTTKENAQNLKPSGYGSTGYLGVTKKASSARWIAKIKVDGYTEYLGCFRCPTAAYVAYSRAKVTRHGFAHRGAA